MKICVTLLASVIGLGACSPVPARTPTEIPNRVQCTTTSDSSKIVQTITWGTDSLVESTPALSKPGAPSSTVITLHGQLYLAVDVTLDATSKRSTALVHFGPAFAGAHDLVLDTVDAETFAGLLGGKKLAPFAKGSTPTFADGAPLPVIAVDERARRELTAFLEAVQAAPNACKAKHAAANRPLYADAASGYRYYPDTGNECRFCLGECVAITSWGVAVAVQACAGTGYAYGVCLTVGIIAAFITGRVCRDLCLSTRPGLCCPTDCNADGVCCDAHDACLATIDHGLCCPPDHPRTCGGRVCCLANDVCNAAAAKCCPAGQSSCGECGLVGQPCCDGTPCAAGSGCASGICVACPAPAPSRTLADQNVSVGGCLPRDFQQVFGGRCHPGSVRGACLATVLHSNDSRAFCHAAWMNEADPGDCRCGVHFQSPNNCNGDILCRIQVTDVRPGTVTPLPLGCPLR